TVLGGPGEERLCGEVGEALCAEVVVERGYARTFEVLARAAVTVSGDTGLMHLAGASGSRVVAVFGPTSPRDGFFVYPGTPVERALPCRPCALHRVERCHLGRQACREDLVEAVVRGVLQSSVSGSER
ncbi:MAG: hypothetical protein KC656_30950, partial [Myxococcales bacterium]|nr:hypothetical protein [Myxococcales bacterium]